jgi:hypothetical protein
MPAFERWNQAGRVWYDTTKTDLTLENLNKTLLTRISRAFQFRDSVFALSTTMVDHEPEEMLCELDSLLLSLVGAFDAAARIVDIVLQLNGGHSIGWQYTASKKWQSKLELPARDLYDYTKDGTEMQRTFQALRWLRNSVHNEALNLTRDDGDFYISTEKETQDKLRDFLREGHPGWTTVTLGVKVQPLGGATAGKWLPGTGRYSVTVRRTGAPKPADPLDGTLVLDVRQLVNKLFPACLSDLNAIMRLAPLTAADPAAVAAHPAAGLPHDPRQPAQSQPAVALERHDGTSVAHALWHYRAHIAQAVGGPYRVVHPATALRLRPVNLPFARHWKPQIRAGRQRGVRMP